MLLTGYFIFGQRTKIGLKGPVKSIRLIRGPMLATSMTTVLCSGFERQWPKDRYDTFDIVTSEDRQNILKHISISKPDSKNREWADKIDPRAKMYIHYTSGATDSLCLTGARLYGLNGQQRWFVDRTIDDWIIMLPDSNSVGWKRRNMR
jgi:hypothetical protein